MVTIMDYGSGNVGSLAKALARLGVEHRLACDPEAIAASDRVILPGVGHFGAVMAALEQRGLRAPILQYLRSGRPFLGICVGLQVLFEGSEEAPGVAGLGLWPGTVRRFAPGPHKVPHVGWARPQAIQPSRLLAGLGAEAAFYFTHSYYVPAGAPTTHRVDYNNRFLAAAEAGAVAGAQFHPEKSGAAGLAVLANFAGAAPLSPAPALVAGVAAGPMRRLIACLDVRGGRVVKGVSFVNLRDCGDPAALARAYNQAGVDELMLLDIAASPEERPILLDTVRRVAAELFVPFAVGGGVRGLADAAALLQAGADKVSVNTAAVARPELIEELARDLGSQAVVAAIDARSRPGGWEVCVNGGRVPTGREVVAWAREAEQRGAGEILLTSMDRDGGQAGFDCELPRAVSAAVAIPVIASGGAGTAADLAEVLGRGGADAVLAASILHDGRVTIADLKRELAAAGIAVRPC